ncbi:alpha/beta hydrolase [Nocardiopsis sp. MG754419]|nr:alpha/beta hydrolase [Nocardiopsis sp. MG754419]
MIPPGADVRHVDTPTGRLRVLHAGSARPDTTPLVLIHGGGTDNAAISWYRLFAPLSVDREVWAPDLPGFGGSLDVPPVGGPRALADVVVRTMEALDVPRAVVVGVSMGGDVALNLALDHPDRVAGLVGIAPGGLVSTLHHRYAQYWAWRSAHLPDTVLFPAARLANRFTRTAVHAIVKDPRSLPVEVVDEFVREASHPRAARGYMRYNQATLGRHGMRNDLTGRVHEITVPALFFHGRDDRLVDPAGSRRAADLMSDALRVEVPDCGHWAQLERHDRFLEETRGFLARIDRVPPASRRDR